MNQIKVFMQKMRDEQISSRLHDVQDLTSTLQTKVEGNEVAVEQLKTTVQDYQEIIEQMEQQYKVVSRENGLLRSKIQNLTARVNDFENQKSVSKTTPTASPSVLPVLVTDPSNPFLVAENKGNPQNTVKFNFDDLDEKLVEKYPIIQKITPE